MQTLFRSKTSKSKFEKILDQGKRSKVNLFDEIRVLDAWLKESEKYLSQFDEEETVFKVNTFDRLKDILRSMYSSPIDMSDSYLKLRARLEIAEALKVELGQILEEHFLA